MQTFGNANDVAAATVKTQLIQLANILDTEELLPPSCLHVCVVEELAGSEVRQVVSIGAAREAQQEAVFKWHHTKGRTASRMRSARPVGEINEIATADGVNRRGAAGSQ